MAQTTASTTFKDAKIEQSVNGTDWIDVSGFANSVTVAGGARQIGKLFTGDADPPIVAADKRDSLQVTVKVAYTEGASDPAEVARQAYEAATPLYYRWSPKGGQSGEFLYTTAPGVVLNPIYPQGEYGSGQVLTLDVTIETPSIAKSVVAP